MTTEFERSRQRLKVANRLGSPMPYSEYLDLQERLRSMRNELILVCEHPPVLTCGVQFKTNSLLASPSVLADRGIELVHISRGGDITAHEPGQIVIYPHADLRARGIGLSAFFQSLLLAAQGALARVWSIESHVDANAPGLYVKGRKIASIGIQFKSFFTSHGIAINVRNTLETFSWIHPCGFHGLEMTTVEREGGDSSRSGLFVDVLIGNLSERLGPGP